ncbi:FAD-dependent monooxygenase [Risungbinella massiliensis]|uniref:FAD-dependent monooxygenase n=1 Tax=Risungbinella massiliensis TaxID=1329796 RepID=UPI000699D36B|nr:FAD-dependent monooxygenase [Risungbinella massiliensis]
MRKWTTDVCVVGAGPAGMILGLLLAKQGIDVTVLERNKNFDREYRGEVLQPAFLNMMADIGLLEMIYQHPHTKLTNGSIFNRDRQLGRFQFSQISEYPFAMWMPQPVMLQAFAEVGKQFSSFHLCFQAAVQKLQYTGEQVTGTIAEVAGEKVEIEAKITIGADGRNSTVSRLGKFEQDYSHYKNDIAWFTIDRPDEWNSALRIQFTDENLFIVLPKYPNHLQAGVFLPKGEYAHLRKAGIEEMKGILEEVGTLFAPFTKDLSDYSAFHLLQSRIFMVRDWAKDGCLLIGDAAHCASPVGAIGVTLAVATSIEAAKVIVDSLQKEDYSAGFLHQVQQKREPSLRSIHQIQMRAERAVAPTTKLLRTVRPVVVPFLFRTGLIPRFLRRVLVETGTIEIPKEFRIYR